MSDKKLDLIAQMLAKAESTTPEEAEALTEHATRLMQKYAIDQATIDARRALHGQTSEKIIEGKVVFTGTYKDSLLDMGSNVVWALGTLRPLESGRDTRKVLWIVGYESDVAQADLLIRSLHVQALVACRAWWKDNAYRYTYGSDWDRRKARLDFIRGFGIGAAARVREARRQVIEEASTGTDLVLLDRGAKVQEFIDGMDLGKSRTGNRKTDEWAQAHGNHAGRNANTGGTAVTQGRGITA